MNEIQIIGFSLYVRCTACLHILVTVTIYKLFSWVFFIKEQNQTSKCKYTDKNLIVKLLNLESSIRLYEPSQSTRHCQVESQQKETKRSLLRRCANDSSRKHSCSSEREDCVTNKAIKKAFLPQPPLPLLRILVLKIHQQCQ